MDVDICTEKSSRSIKEKHVGKEKIRNVNSRNSGEAVHQNERGVWEV